MTRNFGAETVRRTVESGYGVSLRSFEALHGHAHSFNFRAETADGAVFEVKCFPEAKDRRIARLLAHTAPSGSGTLAATRLFEGKVLGFDGWKVIALKWIPGVKRDPDELSDSELHAFLDAHVEFLGGLADDGEILPVLDALALRQKICGRLSGGNAVEILRELDGMPDATLSLAARYCRIIHGDLHSGNFRFANGRVSGFFDLEELRYGTPAEDLVRYVVCCEEHRRWYALRRRRKLLDAFRRILAGTSYARDEWLFAINSCLLRKLARKVKTNRMTAFQRMNLRMRFGFYRTLRGMVDRRCK